MAFFLRSTLPCRTCVAQLARVTRAAHTATAFYRQSRAEVLQSVEKVLESMEGALQDNRWVSQREMQLVFKRLRRIPSGDALCRRALQLASDAGVNLHGRPLGDAILCFARSGDHAGMLAVEREVLASNEAMGNHFVLSSLMHAHVLLDRSDRALELLEGARSSSGTGSSGGGGGGDGGLLAQELLREFLRSVEEEPPLLFDDGSGNMRKSFGFQREAALMASKHCAISLAHKLLQHLCTAALQPSREEVDALVSHFVREESEEELLLRGVRSTEVRPSRPTLWVACLTRLLTSSTLPLCLSPSTLAVALSSILVSTGLAEPAHNRRQALALYTTAMGQGTEELLRDNWYSMPIPMRTAPGIKLLHEAFLKHPPSRRSRLLGNDAVKPRHQKRGREEQAACAAASLLDVASGASGEQRGGLEALLAPQALEALLAMGGGGGAAAAEAPPPPPPPAEGSSRRSSSGGSGASAGYTFTAEPMQSPPLLNLVPGPPALPFSVLAQRTPLLTFGGTPSSVVRGAWASVESMGPSQWLDLHVRVAVGGYLHLLRTFLGAGPPAALHEHVLRALVHRGYLSAAVQVVALLGRAWGGKRAELLQGPLAPVVGELLEQVKAAGLVQGSFAEFKEALLNEKARTKLD